MQDPEAAWRRWLVKYNITYSSATEAEFRKNVFVSNLERADKLNQLVGPEAAVSMAAMPPKQRAGCFGQEQTLAAHTARYWLQR